MSDLSKSVIEKLLAHPPPPPPKKKIKIRKEKKALNPESANPATSLEACRGPIPQGSSPAANLDELGWLQVMESTQKYLLHYVTSHALDYIV